MGRRKVIARGKVLYSEDRTHVYLGTTEIPKATKAKRFEEILDEYEGEMIVVYVERPDKFTLKNVQAVGCSLA